MLSLDNSVTLSKAHNLSLRFLTEKASGLDLQKSSVHILWATLNPHVCWFLWAHVPSSWVVLPHILPNPTVWWHPGLVTHLTSLFPGPFKVRAPHVNPLLPVLCNADTVLYSFDRNVIWANNQPQSLCCFYSPFLCTEWILFSLKYQRPILRHPQ